MWLTLAGLVIVGWLMADNQHVVLDVERVCEFSDEELAPGVRWALLYMRSPVRGGGVVDTLCIVDLEQNVHP